MGKKLASLRPSPPPLARVFSWDCIEPSGAFYDTTPGEFRLVERDGQVAWVASEPWCHRFHLTFPLTSMSEVPPALVELAKARRSAFKLRTLPKSFTRARIVLVPPGDRRLAALACSPDGVVEVEGLAPGLALLFGHERDEEWHTAGWLAQWNTYCEMGIRYGLTVREPFSAVELDAGFESCVAISAGLTTRPTNSPTGADATPRSS